MTESLIDKCQHFQFTRVQLQSIAESLPKPNWENPEAEWRSVLGDPTRAEVKFDKMGLIARTFTPHAIYCLKQALNTQAAFNDGLKTIDAIGKRADDLIGLLSKKSVYQGRFATALLDIEGISTINEPINRGETVLALMHDLKLVSENIGFMKHAFREAHDPEIEGGPVQARKLLMRYLLQYWKDWTGKQAGQSKEGGPAARFVMYVLNPIDEYLKAISGTRLCPHANSPISEPTCGNYIMEASKTLAAEAE